jgi:hypothetical protein
MNLNEIPTIWDEVRTKIETKEFEILLQSQDTSYENNNFIF